MFRTSLSEHMKLQQPKLCPLGQASGYKYRVNKRKKTI